MSLETVLLSGATASGTTSAPLDCRGFRDLTIYLNGTGTISTGTLIVEEAYYNVIGGGVPIVLPPTTWSTVTSTQPLDVTEVTGGASKAYQLPVGCYKFVRVKIGTALTGGGSLTVALVGL